MLLCHTGKMEALLKNATWKREVLIEYVSMDGNATVKDKTVCVQTTTSSLLGKKHTKEDIAFLTPEDAKVSYLAQMCIM